MPEYLYNVSFSAYQKVSQAFRGTGLASKIRSCATKTVREWKQQNSRGDDRKRRRNNFSTWCPADRHALHATTIKWDVNDMLLAWEKRSARRNLSAFPYISPALKGTTPRLSGDSKAKISCCADQSYSRYIQNPFKWNSVGLAPLLRAQLSTVTLISDRHTNTLPRHCCNFLMSPRSSAPRAGSVASRREFTTCDKCRAL